MFIKSYLITASLCLKKNICRYLFLEYLFVSFDLFLQQKQQVFLKILQISKKIPTLEFLFNKVGGLPGHFEEYLWMTASVVNTINSQNFIIICLKGLEFYFTSIYVESWSVKKGLSHRCFCCLKACCKWTNEQNPIVLQTWSQALWAPPPPAGVEGGRLQKGVSQYHYVIYPTQVT